MINKEILLVADAVSNEKGVDREIIFEAIEMALSTATKKRYEEESEIEVVIDRETGDYVTFRRWTVMPDDHFSILGTELTTEEAAEKDTSLQIGDVFREQVENIEFGRIAAQTAKQVIVQRVREAERAQVVDAYRDRLGELISGTVKKVTREAVIVDLGNNAEGLMSREDLVGREAFRVGDRVRAILMDIRDDARGPQLALSRACNEMLIELFSIEVPEIYEGIIEIKSVARDPGSRAKICVHSQDSSIDPVGACVRMRGSRVQAVVGELQGEKIEIIPWSDDPVSFVINALAPAVPSKVVMDEDAGRMEVVVPDDQLSLAIGRRGQNVRLASQLTGWYVDILTEAEESVRRQEEFAERTKIFIDALDIDDVIAHLMVGEGFVSIEDIADASLDELVSIEGFDEGIASELSERAKNYIKVELERVEKSLKKLKINDDLYNFDKLSKQNLLTLVENKIKTLDELAELDSEELFNILGKDVFVNEEEAGSVIMSAREHWFSDDNLDK